MALQQLTPPIAELASELWLLVHPDLRQTARISAVFQLLHAALNQRASVLAGAPTGVNSGFQGGKMNPNFQ